MKFIRKLVVMLVFILGMNILSIGKLLDINNSFVIIAMVLGLMAFVYINIFPNISIHKITTTRLKILDEGLSLLEMFLCTICFEFIYLFTFMKELLIDNKGIFWGNIVIVIIMEAIIFWNGIIRAYVMSVQLGIKWRVVGIVCGWIPIVHLVTLSIIIRIISDEVEFETKKYQINAARKNDKICKTKYPILLVHGVFFRDFRFLNYWGRIPEELVNNGATIFYANQQSAASIEECGTEIADRINQIVKETGCEKVNIIAHSKGGLDTRYAISKMGADKHVATLTTINTPHRGCIFADYLLGSIPKAVCDTVSKQYNTALKKLGDSDPDFMEAVTDLTASSCEKNNEILLDSEYVKYYSVGTKMNKAISGRFPLNMSYPLVRHFDGDNDGLVAVDSAKWGECFTFKCVEKGRGISHADMIDLNRENIKGFDVREFYVDLVNGLRKKGY